MKPQLGATPIRSGTGAAANQPDRKDMDALAVILVLLGPAALAVRDRWPPVKIIITSGKQRPARDAMPSGGVFLPKPYAPAAVAATIHGLLA